MSLLSVPQLGSSRLCLSGRCLSVEGRRAARAQDHPTAWAPCRLRSLQSGTPPAGGHWEKLARLQVWPLTRGSSRRQFLELFTEDLPGPRSLVHHCPSDAPSFSQIIRDIQAKRPSGKESACPRRRCETCRFDPWVGKIPWRRKWQTTPVFLPAKFHRQGNLAGYSPRGSQKN